MPRVTYRLDRDHAGLRLAVLVAALAGAAAGAWLIVPSVANLLSLQENLGCLPSLIGALAVGIGLGWVAEQALRSVWPSGRWLTIDEEGVLLKERASETCIRWTEPIDLLFWHFPIENGKWVPKGWYCVACQLRQNDRAIILYAFMKPSDAETLPLWSRFVALISHRSAQKTGDKHLLSQLEGQDNLRSAENDRWNSGAEMIPTDFTAILTQIDGHLPAQAGMEAARSASQIGG